MSNSNKPPRDDHKSQPSSEISRDIIQLRSRIEQLEKTLQASVNEKNQWSSEIRNWVGKSISISMISGALLLGELRWVDRYTLCLRGTVPADDGPLATTKTIVVHKGAIAFMYQNEAA